MTTPSGSWESLPHKTLYDLVNQGPGRDASRVHEEIWTEVQKVMDDGNTRIRRVLGEAAEGWIGQASAQMQAAARPFTAWCGTAVDDAGGIAKALADQGVQAAELRRLLPGPDWFKSTAIDVGEGLMVAGTVVNGYGVVGEQAAQETASGWREDTAEAEEARRQMAVYATDSRQRESALGFWTTPPAMVVGPAEAPQPGPGGPVAPVGGGGAPGSPAPSPAQGPGAGPVLVAPPVGQGGGPAPGGGRTPQPGPQPTASPGSATPAPGTGRPGPGGAAASPAPTGGAAAGRVPSDGHAPGAGPASSGGRPAPAAVPTPVPVPAPGNAHPAALRPAPPRPPAPGVPLPRGTGINLPEGQGGRGLRPLPAPVAEPSRAGAPSNWRELVARQPPVVGEPVPGRPAVAEPVAGAGSGTNARSGHGMYPPMTGGGAGAGGQTKSRPGYLQDDSGYFADDRWFPPAVIGADDVLPDPPDRS